MDSPDFIAILRPMSIITGRGDSGETDLLFNRRIPKTSLRVEALGAVDELNAALGLARTATHHHPFIALIDALQHRLVGLMGELACLPEDTTKYNEKGYQTLTPADLEWLVQTAKDQEARGVRFTHWATPGAEGSIARAALDLARTVARRAERTILALHQSGEPVPETIRLFFNRLSDFLWILARVENP